MRLDLMKDKEHTVYDKKRGDCLYLTKEITTSPLGQNSKIKLKVADIEIHIDDESGVVLVSGDILETDG